MPMVRCRSCQGQLGANASITLPAGTPNHKLSAFLNWANDAGTDMPLIKAGLAHLWFVKLHPFEDCNGRMDRDISDLFLARADSSPLRFSSLAFKRWSTTELVETKFYLENKPPAAFVAEDYYLELVKWLFPRYLSLDYEPSPEQWARTVTNFPEKIDTNIKKALIRFGWLDSFEI